MKSRTTLLSPICFHSRAPVAIVKNDRVGRIQSKNQLQKPKMGKVLLATDRCAWLFGPAQPRILPRRGDALIVSAEANKCAIAIAGFYGLVFADRERHRPSDS